MSVEERIAADKEELRKRFTTLPPGYVEPGTGQDEHNTIPPAVVDGQLKRLFDALIARITQAPAPILSPMGYNGTPFGGGGARIWNASYTPGQGGFGPFGPGMPNFGPSPGGFGPGTGGGGKFNRGTNAQTTHDFFIAQGWSEAQVAGIMANVQKESGFDPGIVNKTGGDAGLFQWRGPRARQFQAMYGHRVQDGTLQEQLQFAQWELTHTEKRAGDRLRQITEAGAAGDWVTRGFERPDPNHINIIAAERSALARRMQGQYSGGVQVIINNNTGGNAVVTTAALANQT
jgi:hypothetical protein